jgi:hypothetical protein
LIHLSRNVFVRDKLMRFIFLSLFCASAHAAGPQCSLSGRVWLEGRVGRSKLASAVDARVGQVISVFVLADGKIGRKHVIFGEDGQHVSWKKSGCGPISVEWHKVEPRMAHTETRAPNPLAKVYANAVVFGKDHGKWIGYDRLEYFESQFLVSDELILQVRDAAPSNAPPRTQAGVFGTMRLSATLQTPTAHFSSPGVEEAASGQISDRVFRYSFRGGDDFLGWLWSWFNVPYLFGSAGYGKKSQAERRIGADCADVLVAALRKAGHRTLEYTSVAGLVGRLIPVALPLVLPGPLKLTVGRGIADVHPGDLLALDYLDFNGMPKNWNHIVAFVEDLGPNGVADGVLGPEDLVADSGSSAGLKIAPLGAQGRVRIQVLRPNDPRQSSRRKVTAQAL